MELQHTVDRSPIHTQQKYKYLVHLTEFNENEAVQTTEQFLKNKTTYFF